MTILMTPERLLFVLRNKGMQVSSIERYKRLLALCEDSDHELLDCFAKQLNDDASGEAAAWLRLFTQIANSATGVTSNCPRIQRLVGLTSKPASSNQGTPQHRSSAAPARYSSPVPPSAPVNAASAPVRNSSGQLTPESKEEQRRSARAQYRVFGTKAAALFEMDTLHSGPETVVIEMAPCVATREYDWGKKISFQLTRKELPQVVGILAGAALVNTKIEFKGHGDAHDKNLRITQQGAHWLLTVGQRAAMHSVQITPPDSYHLIALCLRALAQNDPHLDSQTILELCKCACSPIPV